MLVNSGLYLRATSRQALTTQELLLEGHGVEAIGNFIVVGLDLT